ncbi:unnamed protein product [Ceutorhynchus assimilis]|uniref:SAM domain-containing protein n=1 Tax=Ceutorhynchus assimilis TaxID=467358 RepID=A0A9N9MYV7_9CUCU|nr:unnamed protein product [Ceutorhynchus assimilis]
MAPIREFLEANKLAHLLEKFEEQNIDEEFLLPFLTESQINELTRGNIGDVIRLKVGIQKYNEHDIRNDTFLNEDIIGQALMQKAKKVPLNNADRDRLAEIIIKPLLNKFQRLGKDDLKILAQKIEKSIPGEKTSTYYVPAINWDFEQLHPSGCNFDLEARFDEFFNSILEVRGSSLCAADNTILDLLKGDLTTDSKTAIQLYLIPVLVPPKGRKQFGKIHWKPSIAESRDGFIQHIKTPGDMEYAKNKRVDLMCARSMTVQPYMLLIGPSLGNILASFVVINNREYKCHSVLDALDFCFKCYQMFDASKSDPKIPYINDLI